MLRLCNLVIDLPLDGLNVRMHQHHPSLKLELEMIVSSYDKNTREFVSHLPQLDAEQVANALMS